MELVSYAKYGSCNCVVFLSCEEGISLVIQILTRYADASFY
jgi:hypothetical protein